jgi:hypothetical protein
MFVMFTDEFLLGFETGLWYGQELRYPALLILLELCTQNVPGIPLETENER